jgi:hypothetical protein
MAFILFYIGFYNSWRLIYTRYALTAICFFVVLVDLSWILDAPGESNLLKHHMIETQELNRHVKLTQIQPRNQQLPHHIILSVYF